MGPAGGPVATEPAGPSAGGFPRLVLDVAGYQLEHASENPVAAQPPLLEVPAPGSLRLSVWAEPGRGYDGRVLFVTVAAPAAGYGVGDLSSEARAVTVGTDAGWIQQYTGLPATSLGWYLPTGQAVHLVGLRLDESELMAAGRDLQVAADGSFTWGRGSPPVGLALDRATESPLGPRTTGEVSYARGAARLSLRLQEGGDAVLDDLIRDRAAAALEIGQTTVGDVPAVLTVYEGEDRSALMWQVRPGVVAELVGYGSAKGDIADAASSISQIDEAAWQDLRRPFREPAAASSADAADGLPSVVRSMCELRGEWLAAGGGGGGAESGQLKDLRRHAVETGLDQDSDIVAVLDRLLAAMAAGDAATVRSIPEGGACA